MRYIFLGILAFIGLALVARVDILDKKEAWTKEPLKFAKSPLHIYQDDQLFWKSEIGMAYLENRIAPVPFSALENGLDSLSSFLKIHNEKMLLIKSSYKKDETEIKVGQFESMGIARAHWLKEQLIAQGISRSRIILRDSLLEYGEENFSLLRIIDQE